MAGKKGRSGPPGNLNNNKHRHRSWWERLALRQEDRGILPTLKAYHASLRSDNPDASEAARRLMEVAQTARGAWMLILSECARSGFIIKGADTWDLSPGAKDLPRFLSIERQALQTLGLERKARTVPLLTDYIEAKRKKDENENN